MTIACLCHQGCVHKPIRKHDKWRDDIYTKGLGEKEIYRKCIIQNRKRTNEGVIAELCSVQPNKVVCGNDFVTSNHSLILIYVHCHNYGHCIVYFVHVYLYFHVPYAYTFWVM